MRIMKGGLEDEGRERRGAPSWAAAVAALAAAAALFAYGASASCSSDAPQPPSEMPAGAGRAEDSASSDKFFGTQNWGFMGEDSMAAFQSGFYAWLLEGGLEDGAYVYLHGEDVSCEDGVWTAYARTPVDDAYYRVRFDASTKDVSYEECAKPAFAQRAESERVEMEAPAAEAGDADAPPDKRDSSANIALDDAAALKARLGERAGGALPSVIAEYASGKGIETAPALCSVYPASIARDGGILRFDVLIYDAQKNGYAVSADYDEAADRFGFALGAL